MSRHRINRRTALRGMLGGAAGYFKYPGTHYRSRTGDESCSTVLLSVLRSVETNATPAGAEGGLVTESCSAIEA